MGWFLGYETPMDSEFLNSLMGVPSTEKLKQRYPRRVNQYENPKNINQIAVLEIRIIVLT